MIKRKQKAKVWYTFLLLAVVLLTSACSMEKNRKTDEFFYELSALDGVKSVRRVELPFIAGLIDYVDARYLVMMEQPIDWDHPELGTFEQRFIVGYKGRDHINCYQCGGYCLGDKFQWILLHYGAQDDLAAHYDANFIEIEYRFFGDSVPKDLSLDSEKYWELLNSEQASKDFHHIISEVSRVLPGNSIFTGASKGGYTAEAMASYFPDDIDAYVSFVAPFCDGIADTRFYENMYNTIGDLTYGTEEAGKHRNTVLEFQKLMLDEKYRSILQPEFIKKFTGGDKKLSPLVTEDEAYECAVLEAGCYTWQYFQEFGPMEEALAMPEGTEEEFEQKLKAVKEIFYGTDPVMMASCSSCFAPYFIQSYTEMGNMKEDLSWLRAAGANIRTPAENDGSLCLRLCSPMMADSSLTYSTEIKDHILDYMKTTEKDIVKVYGKADTWYAVRMPEVDNPHVHVFEVDGSHMSKIDMLPAAEKEECYGIIDRLLDVHPQEEEQ